MLRQPERLLDAAGDASASWTCSMKVRNIIVILILWVCLASNGQSWTALKSNGHKAYHPGIGTVSVYTDSLNIRGDSIVVPPWCHVFGDDPNIRISQWTLGPSVSSEPSSTIDYIELFGSNYPNPFCVPQTSVYFVNLVPDTIVVTILRDDVIPETTIYHGHIERGSFQIRIEFDKNLPPGAYLVVLSVGDEVRETRILDLK